MLLADFFGDHARILPHRSKTGGEFFCTVVVHEHSLSLFCFARVNPDGLKLSEVTIGARSASFNLCLFPTDRDSRGAASYRSRFSGSQPGPEPGRRFNSITKTFWERPWK